MTMSSDEGRPQGDEISEMVIVDTFTRLIFGDDSEFDHRERLILEALGALDGSIVVTEPLAVGDYLRALEVSEMITLVAAVRARLEQAVPVLTGAASATVAAQSHY
jgi:hypothetical protein